MASGRCCGMGCGYDEGLEVSGEGSAVRGGVAGLEAGRELDSLVHRRVMELPVVPDAWGLPMQPGDHWTSDPHGTYTGTPTTTGSPIPAYSTDIAAAWEVVEKLRERRIFLSVDAHWDRFDVDAAIGPSLVVAADFWERAFATADTAPLAICRAALRATTPHTTSQTNEAETSKETTP